MSDFLNWEGWNAVNGICQIVLSILAFVAICITIKQISSKSSVKLSMDLKFGLGAKVEDGCTKIIPGITIGIANLGIAPVYISECGVEFFWGKVVKSGIFVANQSFVLQSGESVIKGSTMIDVLLKETDNEVSLHDKVRIYIKCGTGKVYYSNTGMDYAGFKFEYEKVMKRAEMSNMSNELSTEEE